MQSSNTNSGAPYISNDGTAHKSKIGAKIDDLTPNSSNNSHNNTNSGLTGSHSNNAGFADSNTAGYGQTGQHTGAQYGSTGGLGQSNKQYVSNDGDVHRTAAGAKFDSATPSSNSAGYGSSAGAYGSNNTTGLASHGNTSGGYGSSSTTGLGSNNNEQYLSNSGETHKSKIGAKIDDMTPNSSNNSHSNTNSGLTGTHSNNAGFAGSNTAGYGQPGQHSTTGAGYGSNTGGIGQSNQQYVSNDGDHHKTAVGAKLDSATPSSNTNNSQGQYYGSGTNATHASGTHGTTTHGTHGTHGTTGTHSSAVGHDSAKPSMMDKIKGTTEEMIGKATKNPEKISHGQAVAGKSTTNTL